MRWARWWSLWFLPKTHEGTTTVTSDEIVYQQRVRVLDHARVTGNVAATCRTFGMSRKTFYKWRNAAAKYGLAALRPKTKRPPAMPNTTPTHVIEMLLTLAITLPTLGCRQYADRLADQGFALGKSAVQSHLVSHGLGRRHQRLARAAAITAMTTGLVTPSGLTLPFLSAETPSRICPASNPPSVPELLVWLAVRVPVPSPS